MPRHRLVYAALCSLIALGSTPATAATCAPAQANPEAAVRQMYAAIAAGDRARTIAAFTEDAYLFDGGKRFTPAGITDTILQAEAAGLKPRWTVESPDSHVACDLAWTTWTNHGSFTTPTGVEPKLWLESAILVWQDGRWKIRFFHSTPVKVAG